MHCATVRERAHHLEAPFVKVVRACGNEALLLYYALRHNILSRPQATLDSYMTAGSHT